MTKKLSELRSVIQKANPELMELSFGCLLKDKSDGVEYLFVDWHFNNCPLVIPILSVGHTPYEDGCCWQDTAFSMGSVSNEQVMAPFGEENTYTIIGHPIQLQHVLEVVKIQQKYWTTIEIIETFCTTLIAKFFKLWDLTKDFDHQSPEVHQFLYDILVTKK